MSNNGNDDIGSNQDKQGINKPDESNEPNKPDKDLDGSAETGNVRKRGRRPKTGNESIDA